MGLKPHQSQRLRRPCTHKSLVHDDIYHWSRILATVTESGWICHMDFSEKLSQKHKYEPQSAHFNKYNYSLHLLLNIWIISHHTYIIIHFSGDMKQDSAFTSAVVQHFFHDCELPYIIHIKSHNCSTQFKCGLAFGVAFGEYLKLAKTFDWTIIKYYWPSSHGKWLDDAMSAFGVTIPLRNAAVTCNFKYKSSQGICNMLQAKFKGDMQKKYLLLGYFKTWGTPLGYWCAFKKIQTRTNYCKRIKNQYLPLKWEEIAKMYQKLRILKYEG